MEEALASEYLLRRKRTLQEVCAEKGRCPSAPPGGNCKDCPRGNQASTMQRLKEAFSRYSAIKESRSSEA